MHQLEGQRVGRRQGLDQAAAAAAAHWKVAVVVVELELEQVGR